MDCGKIQWLCKRDIGKFISVLAGCAQTMDKSSKIDNKSGGGIYQFLLNISQPPENYNTM